MNKIWFNIFSMKLKFCKSGWNFAVCSHKIAFKILKSERLGENFGFSPSNLRKNKNMQIFQTIFLKNILKHTIFNFLKNIYRIEGYNKNIIL